MRQGVGMPELPTWTVTFLFTDIGGSTRMWEEYPDVMPDPLEAILMDGPRPRPSSSVEPGPGALARA